MKTKLTLRWERDDGDHREETWERENDGKLYEIFTYIIMLLHLMGDIAKKGEKK